MKDNLLVSVIIPTYNSARTLLMCIESVINCQKSVRSEIIIVDDGSTDDTQALLKPLSEKGLVRYVFKQNGGAASARNLGLQLAKGLYIAFLDADDVMLPGGLSKRLNVFKQFPFLDIVFADYYFISEDSRLQKHQQSWLAENGFLVKASEYVEREENGIYLFNNRFHHFYLRCTPRPISTNTIMISREIVLRKGLFNTDYAIFEDNEYWQRLITGVPVGFISDPVASYLKYRSNLTRNTVQYYNDEIKYNTFLSSSVKKELKEYLRNTIFVRRELGLRHFEKGYYFYKIGSFSDARKELMKSISYWMFNLKAYKVLLANAFRIRR